MQCPCAYSPRSVVLLFVVLFLLPTQLELWREAGQLRQVAELLSKIVLSCHLVASLRAGRYGTTGSEESTPGVLLLSRHWLNRAGFDTAAPVTGHVLAPGERVDACYECSCGDDRDDLAAAGQSDLIHCVPPLVVVSTIISGAGGFVWLCASFYSRPGKDSA